MLRRMFIVVWVILALTVFGGVGSLVNAETLSITIVGTNSGSVKVDNDTAKVCSSGTCTYSFSSGYPVLLLATPRRGVF